MRNIALALVAGLAVLFAQVLVFDHILLFGALNPFPYLFFILLLPADIDRRVLLISSFALGLGIDAFNDSGGLHAAVCGLIAFLRPQFIRLIATQGGLEFDRLGLYDLGFRRFIVYSGLATALHHAFLYTLEAFSWRMMGRALLFSALGTLFTLVVALLILLPFRRKISLR